MYTQQPNAYYQLEPYKGINSRYKCPSCAKTRQFTRYIDIHTNEYLSDSAGKCNRIDKCGYHYTPKQYFFDHPHQRNTAQQFVASHSNKALKSTNNELFVPFYKTNAALLPSQRQKFASHNPSTTDTEPFDTVSQEVYAKSLRYYHHNNFTVGLEKLFGTAIAIELIKQFNIGTAKQPQNGTLFWQVDNSGKVRTGKIMLYDPNTLKRVKNKGLDNNYTSSQQVVNPQQRGIEPAQHSVYAPVVDWVHSRLKKQYHSNEYCLQQCLFGLDQLFTSVIQKPTTIAIVESEKTAIIASVFIPQLVWMATGGAQNLNIRLLKPLKNHRVILFPDVNQYPLWLTKAKQIQQQLKMDILVSDYMEQNATVDMRENGADLADVLVKRDKKTGLALTDDGYPVFWDSNY